MNWDDEQKHVRIRLAFPPMPMTTSLRTGPISGRWSQSGRQTAARTAIATRRAKLIESMAGDGQREAATARFIWWHGRSEGWWPHLQLEERGTAPGSLTILRRRPLIYEGNHRQGVARMLEWPFFLVEAHLWVYEGSETVDTQLIDECVGESMQWLKQYTPVRKVWRPRLSRLRPDHRPVAPDISDLPPFDGSSLESANAWWELARPRLEKEWPVELQRG